MKADRYYVGDDLGTLELFCEDCLKPGGWKPIWRELEGPPTLKVILAAAQAHEKEFHPWF